MLELVGNPEDRVSCEVGDCERKHIECYVMSAPIAQWLERQPSNPAVVRSSPERDGHICACHMGSTVPSGK